MFPYCEGPVPQLCVEKSSVKLVSDDRALEFSFASEFVLRFVFVFVFRFATRFAFALPLLFLLLLVTLAIAKIRITTPMPMKTSTAPMPSNHGQTLRFCGADGGIGLHCGGGAAGCWGGGCGGGTCPG